MHMTNNNILNAGLKVEEEIYKELEINNVNSKSVNEFLANLLEQCYTTPKIMDFYKNKEEIRVIYKNDMYVNPISKYIIEADNIIKIESFIQALIKEYYKNPDKFTLIDPKTVPTEICSHLYSIFYIEKLLINKVANGN